MSVICGAYEHPRIGSFGADVLMSERGFEDQLKQLRDEFQTSRKEETQEREKLQSQIEQQVKQSADILRMLSDQMGLVMRLTEKVGVQVPTSDEGSGRSESVPGRPDGAIRQTVDVPALE